VNASAGDEERRQPMLRIVRGGVPTDEELAALVTAVSVLGATAPGGGDVGARRRGGWSDRTASLRQPMRSGIGAWRAHR
jgi:hypothetical protein